MANSLAEEGIRVCSRMAAFFARVCAKVEAASQIFTNPSSSRMIWACSGLENFSSSRVALLIYAGMAHGRWYQQELQQRATVCSSLCPSIAIRCRPQLHCYYNGTTLVHGENQRSSCSDSLTALLTALLFMSGFSRALSTSFGERERRCLFEGDAEPADLNHRKLDPYDALSEFRNSSTSPDQLGPSLHIVLETVAFGFNA